MSAGTQSLVVSNVRTLLANCTTFQDWTGSQTAEEAAEHIYPFSADLNLLTRPFAVVDVREYRANKETNSSFEHAIGVMLAFEADTEGDEYNESYFAFFDVVSAIVDEMQEKAGTDGLFDMQNIELEDGPNRTGIQLRATEGDYYYVVYRVS